MSGGEGREVTPPLTHPRLPAARKGRLDGRALLRPEPLPLPYWPRRRKRVLLAPLGRPASDDVRGGAPRWTDRLGRPHHLGRDRVFRHIVVVSDDICNSIGSQIELPRAGARPSPRAPLRVRVRLRRTRGSGGRPVPGTTESVQTRSAGARGELRNRGRRARAPRSAPCSACTEHLGPSLHRA